MHAEPCIVRPLSLSVRCGLGYYWHCVLSDDRPLSIQSNASQSWYQSAERLVMHC
jgi:hypothetical protein